MRIGLISDIHGNTVALDAVLAEVLPQVDALVCLGDISAGGPDPGGAIDRIAELGCVAVVGNVDAGMVDMPDWWRDPVGHGLPASVQPGLETCVWAGGELTTEQVDYLAGLPLTAEVDFGRFGPLLAFHGSPRSFDDLIAPTTPDSDLEVMLASAAHPLLAGGHSHVPMVRRYRRQTLLNAGSVGMPFAQYGFAGGVPVLPHADYVMVTGNAEEFAISLRRVPVDPDAVVAMVQRSSMPHGDWWLGHRESGPGDAPTE